MHSVSNSKFEPVLVKLKKSKPRGAHCQPPGPNHGPTASGPRRPPSGSGCHRLAAPTASLLPFPHPPIPTTTPLLSTASSGYKGSHHPPWSTLFFLLRHFTTPSPTIPTAASATLRPPRPHPEHCAAEYDHLVP
jgi:hypothetical protein